MADIMPFDSKVPSRELERYRSWLRLTVELDLDRRLAAKLDLSGVVQQTLWEAHQGLSELQGRSDSALLAWLRQILVRNLLDEIRKAKRAGYDATLDRSLEELSSRSEAALVAEQSSPGSRAVRNEELLRLARALEQLPSDQQTAVLRHHLQEVSLAAVAQEMARSKPAVAGLLRRGLTRLRDLLAKEPSG